MVVAPSVYIKRHYNMHWPPCSLDIGINSVHLKNKQKKSEGCIPVKLHISAVSSSGIEVRLKWKCPWNAAFVSRPSLCILYRCTVASVSCTSTIFCAHYDSWKRIDEKKAALSSPKFIMKCKTKKHFFSEMKALFSFIVFDINHSPNAKLPMMEIIWRPQMVVIHSIAFIESQKKKRKKKSKKFQNLFLIVFLHSERRWRKPWRGQWT